MATLTCEHPRHNFERNRLEVEAEWVVTRTSDCCHGIRINRWCTQCIQKRFKAERVRCSDCNNLNADALYNIESVRRL